MQLISNGYTFKRHELPMIVGSPATPDHHPKRRLAYFLIALFLTFVAGLQNGLLSATLVQLRGEMGLTIVEGGWVQVAYFIGYATFSVLLFKVRQHFGLQKFIRWTLWMVLLSNVLQVLFRHYEVEVFARFMMGIGTSGFFTLAIFYGMQALTSKGKIIGVVVFSGLMQVVPTLSQLIYPFLYQDGDIQAVFLFQCFATLLGIGLTRLLPLPPSFLQKSLTWLDLLSFVLFVVGIGLLAAFLVQGNVVWWDTPWLGALLAGSVGCLAVMFWIESHRHQPMIAWHWVSSKQIFMFLFVAMLTRLFTTEQSVGANSILTLFGLTANELTLYNTIMWLSSLAGLGVNILTLKLTEIRRSTMIAMFGLAIGAYLNIGVGMQTRAEQFYVSQGIIAFSSFYFAGPAFIEGFLRAFTIGTHYVITFIALFTTTQTMGALLGAAGFNAYITVQSKVHLQNISQQLTALDPAMLPERVGDVTKQATMEATLLAYNDLFELIFFIVGIGALIAFSLWLYRKINKINLLAKELAALQAMMKR